MKRIILSEELKKIYSISDEFVLKCANQKRSSAIEVKQKIDKPTYGVVLLDQTTCICGCGAMIDSNQTFRVTSKIAYSADLKHYVTKHYFSWPDELMDLDWGSFDLESDEISNLSERIMDEDFSDYKIIEL